jgi:integrase
LAPLLFHFHCAGFQQVELHFHDLRRTTVTLLSEVGCRPQQIATITGHLFKTVHRILERYLARIRGLAELW